MTFDSRPDTYAHILTVQKLLMQVIQELQQRLLEHDATKLVQPELEAYDRVVPKLSELVYGSDEYKAVLKEMGPTLQHHYAHNRHHSEFFPNGISGMNLIDVIEMVCDWAAASQRTKKSVDANRYSSGLEQSLDVNKKRFEIDDLLMTIIRNTYRDLGLINVLEEGSTSA